MHSLLPIVDPLALPCWRALALTLHSRLSLVLYYISNTMTSQFPTHSALKFSLRCSQLLVYRSIKLTFWCCQLQGICPSGACWCTFTPPFMPGWYPAIDGRKKGPKRGLLAVICSWTKSLRISFGFSLCFAALQVRKMLYNSLKSGMAQVCLIHTYQLSNVQQMDWANWISDPGFWFKRRFMGFSFPSFPSSPLYKLNLPDIVYRTPCIVTHSSMYCYTSHRGRLSILLIYIVSDILMGTENSCAPWTHFSPQNGLWKRRCAQHHVSINKR